MKADTFFGLLTLILIGLKLTNYIDWSWWLVLLPLYISWVLIFIIVILQIIAKGVKNEN